MSTVVYMFSEDKMQMLKLDCILLRSENGLCSISSPVNILLDWRETSKWLICD